MLSLSEKEDSDAERAAKFIGWIRQMNKSMDIPEKFDIEYKDEDVQEMIEHAFKEGNPLYPVPKEFRKKDFEKIYRIVLK